MIKVAPARMVSKLSREDPIGVPAGVICTMYNFNEELDVGIYRIGERLVDGDVVHLISPKTIYMDGSTLDEIHRICNNNSSFNVKGSFMTYDYKKLFTEINKYVNDNLNKFSYRITHLHTKCICRDPLYNYYHNYTVD